MQQRLEQLKLENKALKLQIDTTLRDLQLSIKIAFDFNRRIQLLQKESEQKSVLASHYLDVSVTYAGRWTEALEEKKVLEQQVESLSVKLKRNNRTRNYIIGGLLVSLIATISIR